MKLSALFNSGRKRVIAAGVAVSVAFGGAATWWIMAPDYADNIRVVDGDGLVVDGRKIRIWGIDAPELRQTCTVNRTTYACGQDAKKELESIIAQGRVHCTTRNTDRYGRHVSQCFAGRVDIAAEMVRRGHALDWDEYSKGAYDAEERAASRANRGIWRGNFTPPWEWRAQKRRR